MRKKVLSTILCLTTGLSVLVGCGSTSAETTENPTNETTSEAVAQENKTEASSDAQAGNTEEEVTITYWGWDVSNFAQPLMDKYHELHPNVTFEPTAVEWGDMIPKTQQALASGSELPTIIPMDLGLLGVWKNMDIFEDLTQYGLDVSKYNPALMASTTDDNGKVFGLHEAVNPAAIAYKRDLAEKYLGTSDPDEIQAMLQSYDDYIKVGTKIKEASGGKAFMFHSGQAIAEWFYFASTTPNAVDGNINATAKYTEIMDLLTSFRDAGIVDTYQNGTPEGNATYADDSHIFYPCPDWAVSYYIQANDPDGAARGNWGLIMAPQGYQHGGAAMGITSASSDAQKKAAYDFITWAISSEEGATIMRDTAGYITHDSTINTGDFAKRSDEAVFGGEDISTLFYKTIAGRIEIATPSAYDGNITDVRNDIAQQVMNDSSMDTATAVQAAIDELSTLITDTNVTIK
jgi:multiple sugar transport system substrate-binding protein